MTRTSRRVKWREGTLPFARLHQSPGRNAGERCLFIISKSKESFASGLRETENLVAIRLSAHLPIETYASLNSKLRSKSWSAPT